MSLFRCCFRKSKEKDHDGDKTSAIQKNLGKSETRDQDDVETSAVQKNLTLCGEMDWIVNFNPSDENWTERTSRDFIFFFPEANKFFKFGLKMEPKHYCNRHPASFISLHLINMNSEDLEISTVFRRHRSKNVIKAGSMHELWGMMSSEDLAKELIHGKLNFHVDFSFSNATFKNVDPKLHEAQMSLLRDAAFADFAIECGPEKYPCECGPEKFPCHKAILANHSDFFARLFSSQEWIESERNTFQINGHDPAVVKHMMEFVYACQIPDRTQCSLELLHIAEQFNLKDLVQFCKLEIEKASSCDNTLAKTLALEKKLSLRAEMDWSIKTFNTNNEDWVERMSPDFSFFFPEINKTFKFGLKLIQGHFCKFHPLHSFVCLHLVNQNSEDLKMTAISSQLFRWGNNSFEDVLVMAKSSRPIFEIATKDFTKYYIHGKFHVDFSISYPIYINLDPKLHKAQRRLLTDAAYVDFAIECGTEKFPCHKAILANRSDFFARLFSSQEWIESERNTFQINGHDPAVVKQMLEFVYAYQIPDGTESSLDLLLIANQFNLKDLIKFCEAMIAKTLSCDNALKILRVADEVPAASHLKEYVVQFVAKNISTLMDTEDWKEAVDPKPELLKTIKKIV